MIYTFSALLAIPLFALILLSNSAIQTYFAQKFANHLSEELKTEISISRVKLSFNLHLILEDVFINDQYHSQLLRAHEIDCKIKKFSFKKKRIEFSKILLNDNDIAIVKYKNDSVFNFQFLVNYFKSEDTATSTKSDWKISGKSIEIKKTNLKFQNQDKMNFINSSIDFNDLEIKDLSCKFDSLKILKDSLSLDINHLAFTDKSGFILKNLTTRIKIYPGNFDFQYLHIETPGSNISLDCSISYNKKEDLNDFINKVKIKSEIRPSKLNSNDLAYFIKELKGMNNLMTFSGMVLGNVSNLKLRKFKLNYGRSTSFEGAVSLNGLPDIEETFIRVTVDRLTTSKADLEEFSLPGKNNNHILVPKEFLSFGNVFVKGEFTGFYNDFNAYADFITQNGNFATDITLKKDKTNRIVYNGHLIAEKFNLGYYLNTPNVLGKLNLNAEISGSGIDAKTAKISMKGDINKFEFKGNVYDSIEIKGDLANNQFNGFFNVNDENIDLQFLGKVDFSDQTPVFDFNAKIANANLHKLKLIDSDSSGLLSTAMNINFIGKNFDDIIGTIKFNNTTYKNNKKAYKLDELKLFTFSDSINRRNIELYSDYINGKMIGYFKFSDLPHTFNLFIKNYLPSFNPIQTYKPAQLLKYEQNFEFNFDLVNTYELTDLFIPDLKISNNAGIYGSYNSKNIDFELNAKSDFVSYKDRVLENFYLEGKSNGAEYMSVNTNCEKLKLADNIAVDNFKIFALFQSNSINYSIFWQDTLRKIRNSGDIRGKMDFSSAPIINMQIIKAELFINDSSWKLMNKNTISFYKSDISVQNLEIGDKNQSIQINGKISKSENEKLILRFNHFNISHIDFLTVNNNIDVDGIINGDIELIDIYNSPNFYSDLKINSLCFNKDRLGDLNLFSTWDREKNGLFVNANLLYKGLDTTLFVSGLYYPTNKKTNFDFDIRLNQLRLNSLTHFFKSFSSNFDGQAIGNLSFKGSVEKPEINGKVLLLRSHMYVDYLGVNYSISNSDSIEINTNYFKFKNLGILHEKGRATMDGMITHNAFRNIMIDLNFNYKNLKVLNTKSTDNDLFYGEAYASGMLKIQGPDHNIHLDIRANTEKNTKVFIPLVNKTITYENNFVNFVQKYKRNETKLVSSNKFKGVSMKFELEATPDAEIGIRLENPQTTGDITASGNGNIQMSINKEGEFKMYGDYILNGEGVYLFTIQNIISKKFNIQNGSTISWNGDPYDAKVDLKAIYNVKASLYPVLVGTAENVSKKKVQVQDIISIQGKLTNPNIGFDINLPNVDQDIKDRFFSILDRNDQEQMIQQSLSLLAMNQFISQNRNTYSSSIGNSVSSTSFDMISNQISNWLSQINKDFNISLNYRPEDQLTSQELQIALSTQILNDRVTFDGNFGVGGNLRQESQNNKNSNIIGDFNVEVKITEDGRLRFRAFNRSNNNDFTNYFSPYTQGVGFFYRRDFDNIKELFRNPKSK